MGIKIKIKERNGRFISSDSGTIKKNVKVIHQYEDFRGSQGPCDYDFPAQRDYNHGCEDLSTTISMWMNRPTYEDKTLSVSDITLTVKKKNVIIKSKTFENTNNSKEKSCNVHLKKEVSNSVVSSWSDRNFDFSGERIKYEIDTEDSSSFYFSNPFGEKIELNESMVLKDPNATDPFVSIEPQESIDVELTAVKNTVKALITYKCENDDNDDDTSYSYETLKLVFYSNPKLEF